MSSCLTKLLKAFLSSILQRLPLKQKMSLNCLQGRFSKRVNNSCKYRKWFQEKMPLLVISHLYLQKGILRDLKSLNQEHNCQRALINPCQNNNRLQKQMQINSKHKVYQKMIVRVELQMPTLEGSIIAQLNYCFGAKRCVKPSNMLPELSNRLSGERNLSNKYRNNWSSSHKPMSISQ